MLAVDLLHVHASPANLHMQTASSHSLQGFGHAKCAALLAFRCRLACGAKQHALTFQCHVVSASQIWTRFERVTGIVQKTSNMQNLSACKMPTCDWIVKGFMVCKGHGPQELPLVSLKPRCLQIQLPCIHAESVLTTCSDRAAKAAVGVLSHLW